MGRKSLALGLFLLAGSSFALDLVPTPFFFVSKAQIEAKKAELERQLSVVVEKKPVYERQIREVVLLHRTDKYARTIERTIRRDVERTHTYERQWEVLKTPTGTVIGRNLLGTIYRGYADRVLSTRVVSQRELSRTYLGSTYSEVGRTTEQIGTRYVHTCYFVNGELLGCW